MYSWSLEHYFDVLVSGNNDVGVFGMRMFHKPLEQTNSIEDVQNGGPESRSDQSRGSTISGSGVSILPVLHF